MTSVRSLIIKNPGYWYDSQQSINNNIKTKTNKNIKIKYISKIASKLKL